MYDSCVLVSPCATSLRSSYMQEMMWCVLFQILTKVFAFSLNWKIKGWAYVNNSDGFKSILKFVRLHSLLCSQIIDEDETQFMTNCPPAVTESTPRRRTRIQVFWTAPPAGSGCVTLKWVWVLFPLLFGITHNQQYLSYINNVCHMEQFLVNWHCNSTNDILFFFLFLYK